MSIEQRKNIFNTLRFRIVIWYVAVVLVTVAGVLYFMREGVISQTRSELDYILKADAVDVLRRIELARGTDFQYLKPALELRAQDHEHDGWFVVFLDANDRAIWRTKNAPRLAGTIIPAEELVDFEGYRLIKKTLSQPDGELAAIRLGASYRALAGSLEQIDRMAWVAGLVVLFVAPILGMILVPQALAPLTKMTETAERLRPSRHMERLVVSGTVDEVDRLAEAFNRLLDRMADYLSQKHDFLNNAAHELRTPLAAIRSAVEVQLERPNLDEEQREVLTQVIEETSALHHLVNQLLLLASSDADRIATHAEPVDLSGVVRDAVEMFRAVAEVAEIEIITEIAPQCIVEGNRHSLRQVLNNLLDNAIKFTSGVATTRDLSRRKCVAVYLQPDAKQEHVILTIADTGIGVAAEDLPRLGERFYRADKSRRRSGVGGTGLGLSICKALINAHHGTLEIAGELGKGATVTILLPRMQLAKKKGEAFPG